MVTIKRLIERIILICRNKAHCHHCCYIFGAPDVGFTKDGIDLCLKCYDELKPYIDFPIYLNSNICNFLYNTICEYKFIKSKLSHIHEWKLDYDEDNYNSEFYVCLRCNGFRSIESHTRWRWNPFVTWY